MGLQLASSFLLVSVIVVALDAGVSLADSSGSILLFSDVETTFLEVLRDFDNKDPSWQVNNSLRNWAGSNDCPGENCTFSACETRARGIPHLQHLKKLSYFAHLDFTGCVPPGSVWAAADALESLPEGLKSLSLPSSSLSGTVDWAWLPEELVKLDLSGNALSGSVSWQTLRRSLKILDLSNNDFSGTVSATELPSNLERLMIGSNSFEGEFNGSTMRLQTVLRFVNVSHNRLSGSCAFETWPRQITTIDVGHNQFRGTVNLRAIPPNLTCIILNNNLFSGSVDLTALPEVMEKVDLGDNAFSGAADLSKLPVGLRTLRLGGNRLSGVLDVAKLPPALELDVCDTDFARVGPSESVAPGPIAPTSTRLAASVGPKAPATQPIINGSGFGNCSPPRIRSTGIRTDVDVLSSPDTSSSRLFLLVAACVSVVAVAVILGAAVLVERARERSRRVKGRVVAKGTQRGCLSRKASAVTFGEATVIEV